MTEHLNDLLASIQGAPVLDPGDLAAAIVEAQKTDRLGDIKAALATKPAPKIPPRYESEIRTWLATSTIDADPEAARTYAYAAVHLDPHNPGAISALERALEALGDDVRRNTWSALLHSYPDVGPVREVAAQLGIEAVRRRVAQDTRKRRRRRSTDPVLVDASQPKDKARTDDKRSQRKHRPEGIAALVPALEPDPVQADRLAVVHIVLGNSWDPDAVDSRNGLDPLTWAQRSLRGDSLEPPQQAAGTAAVIALLRGDRDPSGEQRLGPRFGKVIRRLKGHPAVVIWAARRQLDAGDVDGAQRARERLDAGKAGPHASELRELDDLLAVAGGDVERGWAAWQAKELPDSLRPALARALIAAGRGTDADEILGLPEVDAAAIADPRLLEVRFDAMYDDGNIDGAVAQAERLVEVGDEPEAAIGRLWLALATSGRLAALASRADADATRMSGDADALARSLAEDVSRRAADLLAPIRTDLADARSAAQTLAKGRTIRDEAAFKEVAADLETRVSELSSQLARLASLEAGEYPVTDEAVVRFLASARGWHTELVGDRVRVVADATPAEALEQRVVNLLTEPARVFAERAALLERRLSEGIELIASAEAEAQRTDIARRRLEERVSRRARRAADIFGSALEALDLTEPVAELGGVSIDDIDDDGDSEAVPDTESTRDDEADADDPADDDVDDAEGDTAASEESSRPDDHEPPYGDGADLGPRETSGGGRDAESGGRWWRRLK